MVPFEGGALLLGTSNGALLLETVVVDMLHLVRDVFLLEGEIIRIVVACLHLIALVLLVVSVGRFVARIIFVTSVDVILCRNVHPNPTPRQVLLNRERARPAP